MEEIKTFDDFLAECAVVNGTYIFQTTEQYVLDQWTGNIELPEDFADTLIEARVFNETCEYKYFRSGIGSDFMFRKIGPEDESTDGLYGDYYDQRQFLDIDSGQSVDQFKINHTVTTTGEGIWYKVPVHKLNEDVSVTIRYYVERYEETGQARVFDWRVVKIDGGCE